MYRKRAHFAPPQFRASDQVAQIRSDDDYYRQVVEDLKSKLKRKIGTDQWYEVFLDDRLPACPSWKQLASIFTAVNNYCLSHTEYSSRDLIEVALSVVQDKPL